MKKLKVYVAGHNGMVGRAIVRQLQKVKEVTLFTADSKSLDLRKSDLTEKFIKEMNPDVVIDSAARVGGILYNKTYPYDFIYDNLQIQNNLINASLKHNIKQLIFLGSSCIYPRDAKQPLKEEYLMTGKLEPTNQSYALAKIAGVRMVESIREQFDLNEWVTLMPTNLYGPYDNFNLQNSHVIPALIRKFYEAKNQKSEQIEVWGDGSALREFMHVEDLAKAVIFSINKKFDSHLYNVGSGEEVTIKQLVGIISGIVGYQGKVEWDSSKPNGTPRKLIDSSKLNNLGWSSEVSLESGLQTTIDWFIENYEGYNRV